MGNYKRRPAMEPGMSEAEVKVIVNDAFADYEEKTGKPRHEENLANFADLFKAFNQAKGAFIALGLLVGLPGCIASILVIVKTVRGH